jgi:germination protein M
VATRSIPAGMRFLVVPSALAAVVVFAACSGSDTKTVTVRETVTETATSSVPSEAPAMVALYFLRDGKVAPVSRGVVGGSESDLATAAVEELVAGPEGEAALDTAIPDATTPGSVEVNGELAIVQLTPEPKARAARAQVVYTLTAIPNVKRVSFGGENPVGRKAFEAQTPAILVESPLPDEQVESGFAVTGTANTFEATFNYELRDAAGKVLRKNFVTATSGSGTRGTFKFSVRYTIDKPQEGKLVVFELSAADGSRINESEIPLRLE